jgi:hypothetical protein
MKLSIFLKTYYCTAILATSFLMSGPLAAEPEGTLPEADCHKHHEKKEPRVYASFRSDDFQVLPPGTNVSFDITDTNAGNGVTLIGAADQFRVNVTGDYLINYGISDGQFGRLEMTQNWGVSLIVTRNSTQFTKDQILISTSSAIILHLQVNDNVRIASQENGGNTIILSPGSLPGTTIEGNTDTAYITFVKLN